MKWEWNHQQGIDGVEIVEGIGFGGPVWSRSVENSRGEEVECVLEAKLLVVGAGE